MIAISVCSTAQRELSLPTCANKNKKILDAPKGIGYWLWKPFIILETMKNISEGDVIVYSDSGIEIIENLDPLITICKEQKPVLLFANENLKNQI